MSNQVIANFSYGMFQLAKESNEVENFKKQIQDLLIVLNENQSWVDLMSSFSIEQHEKRSLIDQAFKANYHPYIINFLKIVVDKKRFYAITTILNDFIKLCNNDAGIVSGVVYSNEFLERDMIIQLEQSFSQKLDKKITLENHIDRTLIAGARVEIDHKVYDNTLKSKLAQLRNEMLSGE